MQHEITRAIPLLDSEGNLTEPGYAKKLRRSVAAPTSGAAVNASQNVIITLSITAASPRAHRGRQRLHGVDRSSSSDFENGWEITTSPMSFMPLGKLHMPETSAVGDVHHAGAGTASLLKTTAADTVRLSRR